MDEATAVKKEKEVHTDDRLPMELRGINKQPDSTPHHIDVPWNVTQFKIQKSIIN